MGHSAAPHIKNAIYLNTARQQYNKVGKIQAICYLLSVDASLYSACASWWCRFLSLWYERNSKTIGLNVKWGGKMKKGWEKGVVGELRGDFSLGATVNFMLCILLSCLSNCASVPHELQKHCLPQAGGYTVSVRISGASSHASTQYTHSYTQLHHKTIKWNFTGN